MQNKKGLENKFQPFIVGVAGFEPATPWSQTRCANRTALYPVLIFFYAVRGGFEPPVQLPVRQFSKLLVSATHPPHLFLFYSRTYGKFSIRQPTDQPLTHNAFLFHFPDIRQVSHLSTDGLATYISLL
jgi:hypothetical protein